MSLARLSGWCCGWLAALAAFASSICLAQAGGQGEKVEISAPTSPIVISNLTDQLNPALDRLNSSGFRQMQNDFFRPPVDSMQGVLNLPTPSAVLQQEQSRQGMSRRTKELLDKRRNWVFSDLNDLYPDPKAEDLLGIKGLDADDGSVSVIEKYYERQDKKPASGILGSSTNGRPWELDGLKNDFTGATAFGTLGTTGNGNSSFGKSFFSTGQDSQGQNLGTVTAKDASGYAVGSPEDLALKRRREEFSHLLDSSGLGQTSTTSGTLGGAYGNPYGQAGATPLGSISGNQASQASNQPHRSVLYPLTGPADPNAAALHSAVYDDPTAAALGLPNPKIPTVQPNAKRETVQMMLDPYKAGMAKPRF